MKRLLLVPLALLLSLAFLGWGEVAQARKPDSQIVVYVTETGTKYHRDGCRYLRQSKIKTTLADAKAGDYTACKVCKPPK